jgi:hypothetical protein
MFHASISEAQNNKDYALESFCDIQKTFDTVDNSILLYKLSKLGTRGTKLKCFGSYFSDHKKFVFLDGYAVTFTLYFLVFHKGPYLNPCYS